MKQFYLKFYTLLLCLVIGGGNSFATNYRLVTSASDLVAGKKYIMANGTSGDVYVVSTESYSNNRRTTTAEVSDGIIAFTEAMMVFELGGESNAWTFTTTNYAGTDGYLYNDDTSNNRLKVGNNTKTNEFTISFANNVISSITCNGNTTKGVMCFNGNLVACYGSKSSSYKVPQLYVEDGEGVAVEGVSLSSSTASIYVGEKITLIPTISPTNATIKSVTWASSDEGVAKVSNGEVTGVSDGTATITVTTTDGKKTASCVITVKSVAVTGVSLSETSKSIMVYEKFTLTATVAPADATNKLVEWSSDDETVAKVDKDGEVVAIAPGTATITVKTLDGNYTASCEVTVTAAPEPDEYNFLFAPAGSDGDSSTSLSASTALNKAFADGYQYVSSITADRVYPARNSLGYGVKFGSSSVAGTITINLKKAVPAKYIIVSAAAYGDTEGQQGFKVNDKNVSMSTALNKVYSDYVIKLNGSDLSKITLAQAEANKGRIYVEYIKLITGDTYYASCSRKLTAQKSGAYYATFSSDKVTFFPKDYIVSAVGVEDGQLYQFDNEEAFDEDNVEINGEDVIGYYVPANTGVLVTSLENTVNYYTVDGVTPSNYAEAVNMLRPASASMTGDYKFYKLAYDDYEKETGLGFYWGADKGGIFSCKAGTAYLAVPPSALAVPTDPAVKSFVFADDATSVKSVAVPTVDANAPVYNMAGQRVSANTKGIVFQNGKKYFNK